MTRAHRPVFLLVVLLASSAVSLAQVKTGTPPFGTFGGGPDAIDLANLNVQITAPVLDKPGRSLPFYLSLTYDSSIWSVAAGVSGPSWQPTINWGWGNSGSDIGHITFSISTYNCIVSGRVVGTKKFWSNWVYYDGSGTPHPFYGSVEGDTAACPSGGGTDSLSELAQDGSGYALDLTGNCCTSKIDKILVVSPGGASITPGSRIQDTNGNVISSDGLGNLSDTLGSVAISTSGSSPSPVNYTYTDSSGHPAAVQVTYKPYTVQTNFGCSGISEYGPTANSLVDKITLPNTTFYQFNYESTPGSATNVTGRLASVTFPTGGTISYLYTGGSHGIECTDGSTAGFTRTTPDGTWSYSRTPGTGQQSTTTITDPQGSQTVIQFAAIYQTVSQSYQGSAVSGTLLQTTSTCYNGMTTNCTSVTFSGPPFAPLISQRAITMQLASSGLTYKEVNLYDTNGMLTEVDDYDYGSGAAGPLLRKTLNTYFDWSDGLPAKLNGVTIQNGAGTQIAQTKYNYDETTPVATSGLPQHVAVFLARRNMTSMSRWLNTTNAFLTSHMTYFDTGMLNTAADPNNHTTTYAYSSTFAGAYPTTVTNALSQSTTNNFNFNTGLITSTTDPNGQITNYTYDSMLRPSQISYPGGGQATFTHQETTFPFSATQTGKITSTKNLVSASLFDGLGRVMQTQLNSDPDGVTFADTTFDAMGRVATVSNPHRSAVLPTDGTTKYFYDALGRTCLVVPPDGTLPSGNVCPAAQPTNTIFTTYSGNTTTVTDQAGKSRKSVLDALGRLTQVFEDPTGLNYETDYSYDALANLLAVNQKGGSTNSVNWRTRTFTYDSLSRLLTASNPESGTVTYTYNADGTLATKVAPAPNQTGSATIATTYSYDALHRATQKSFSDGTTPTLKYGYDSIAPVGCTPPALTITNGISRRTSMCDGAGAEAWSYDTMGRPLGDQRTTNGITKATTYTYNLDGSVATLTYPSGRTITYAPGAASRPISAVDSSGPINYASGALYSPAGALSSFTNGASIVSTYFYNSRLQPCRISVKFSGTAPASCTDAATGNVLDFSYNLSLGTSDNGNVTAISNNRDTSRSQSFTYESLNRISTAKTTSTSGSTCWDESFGYDPWGNLLSIGRISGYTCSNEELLSVTATTNNRISGDTYDTAGNLITIPTVASYTFDAENHLKTAAGVTYTYDGDGKRVQKSSGKLYWYGIGSDPLDETDLAGNTTNASFSEYIFFGGKRIARRDSTNAANYYFADHLGTAHIVANSSGTPVDDSDFYPFGGERNYLNSSPQSYKFTGKERDSESGLDNFGARYNSSSMGRFMSPDPSNLSVDFWLPQTWNRYTYALNNPLTIVDRNGQWPTYIHNEIINEAFPGLSRDQLQTLRQASHDTDYSNRVNGHDPQDPEVSFVHGMSDGVNTQDPLQAQQQGDAFIAQNEHDAQQIQADWVAAGNTGIAPAALTAFGNALHTIEDRLSPAHAGNQPWYGTQGARNKARALRHVYQESTINQAQMNAALAAARRAFSQTFGLQLGLLAIQRQRACTTIQGPNGPETHCVD